MDTRELIDVMKPDLGAGDLNRDMERLGLAIDLRLARDARRIADLRDVLADCKRYFTDRIDLNASGNPNDAMYLMTLIDRVLR